MNISSLTYDKTSGIGTVTTSDTHGLVADNVIFIGGATENFYNRDYRCNSGSEFNTFSINIGISTQTPTVSGTLRGYYPGESPDWNIHSV